MKIGIITIHFAYNYGAMLQSYALKHYLETLGNEVSIIDYRPYYIDKNYHFYLKSLFLNTRSALSYLLKPKIDRSSFERFLNEYILKDKAVLKKQMNEYDVLITGSDQLWNPLITNYDENYLFNFLDNYKGNIISYAPSIAVKSIETKWEDILVKSLNKYSRISLREIKNYIYLEDLMGKNIHEVLDPTLLLNRKDYEELEVKPSGLNNVDKYLLVYKLEDNKDLETKLIEYKNKYGYKIVSIHPFSKYDLADINLIDIGPQEFLWLVHNAEYVFTNSFHGTVFSMLYSKKVYTLQFTNTGSRMENLINKIRPYKDEKGFYQMTDDSFLNKEIEGSKKWLKESINN